MKEPFSGFAQDIMGPFVHRLLEVVQEINTMKKYRVTLTRQVEQKCYIFVDAVSEQDAKDEALGLAIEISDMVWTIKGSDRLFDILEVEPAEHLSKTGE